ncbi:MAG: SEL1-like repeat protein, partial [Alistipes sp.]
MKKNLLLLLLVLLSVSIAFFQHLTPKLPKDASKEMKATYDKAKRGDSQAQYRVGVYYEQGVGVEQDYTEAVEWY